MLSILEGLSLESFEKSPFKSPSLFGYYAKIPEFSKNQPIYLPPAFSAFLGSSVLTAVCVSKTGNFTICDEKRGRLFTYDSEGNLLYITGEKGTLSNNINQPVALSYLTIGEDDDPNKQELLLVVDKTSKSIISFTTSEEFKV